MLVLSPVLLLSAVNQQYERNVIEERYSQKRELNAAVAGEHCNRTDRQIGDDPDGVFDAEGVQVRRALEAGVDDVGEGSGGEKAEEPFAPREKVILVAGVVFEVGREEQRAEEVEENGVEDDEEIAGEGPCLNHRQAELPPPEMNDPKQERCGPSEVKDGDSLAAGMLHEPGESAKQRRDAEADDDGDDDANVEVKVGVGGGEGHR